MLWWAGLRTRTKALLALTVSLFACSGSQRSPEDRARRDETPFAASWRTPELGYRDVPPLFGDQGFACHVVDDGDDTILARGGLHVFPASPGSWAAVRGNLYRWGEDAPSAENPTATIPLTSTDEVRLTADARVLFVSRGVDLMRVEIDEAGGRVSRARVLAAPPLAIQAHPQGVLLVESRARRLLALDPVSLEPRWAVGAVCCAPLGLTESFGFVLRQVEGDWTLAQIDLARGTVLREVTITGPLVAPSVQSGTRIWALLEDDSGRLGESTSRLFLEEIDVATGERHVVDLAARKAGFGSVYSSLVVVRSPSGEVSGVAVLVNGETGRLRWWSEGELSEVSFPEEERNSGQRSMVQLGPSLVVAVGSRLHVFDSQLPVHRGTIHLPDTIRGIAEIEGDLLIETDPRSYRIRPEPLRGGSAARLDYVRVQPYRFGDPGAFTDGDPSSTWRFVGHEAQVEVVFTAPTVVPPITLAPVSTSGEEGVVTSVRATFLARETGTDGEAVMIDVAGSRPSELVRDVRIARRVSLALRCDCPESSPRCRACVVGDLTIGGAPRE